MLTTIFLFLVGVVLLVYGADSLVRGASALAEQFRIPKSVAGLTMVALGTSAPELFVNVLAALEGNTTFALANVSGSNLANMCLGFGICGVIGGISISRHEFGWDLLAMVASAVLVTTLFYTRSAGNLPFWAFIPLTILLVSFCYSLCSRPNFDEPDEQVSHSKVGISSLFLVAGSVALYFGAEMVLKSAIHVAGALKVGNDVVALTAVALGTSVPDISATVIAAKKKEFGIAVGNILGSNVSNIVLVLNSTLIAGGASLPASRAVRADYLVVCLVSLFVCAVAFSVGRVTRQIGWAMVVGYLCYLLFRIAML